MGESDKIVTISFTGYRIRDVEIVRKYKPKKERECALCGDTKDVDNCPVYPKSVKGTSRSNWKVVLCGRCKRRVRGSNPPLDYVKRPNLYRMLQGAYAGRVTISSSDWSEAMGGLGEPE